MAVDSNTTIIFCEGKPDSLDYLLLNHILPVGQVRIQPVGGKHSLPAYVQGHLASYPEAARPAHIAFRDRDFDVEPAERPRLQQLRKGQIWLSYRAAIENYLIDAALIQQYWREHENAPKWAYGAAPPLNEIEMHIDASARELADYQAVRWALAQLKPGLRWPEISTSWTSKGSGDLPVSLDYKACLSHARQLVKIFQREIQDITSERLDGYAEMYRQKFNAPRFFTEKKYLVWFHGKDHLKLLCPRLASNFPRRHFSKWAIQRIDLQSHHDLQQLVSLSSSSS